MSWKGQLKKFLTRLEKRAIILLYHRVSDLPNDVQSLGVSPKHFEDHMKILKKYFCPVSLADLVSKGALKKKSVVVTFDDGYSDNYYHAKPILEKYEIPATVFVSTGYAERQQNFWWDELDFLFFHLNTSLPSLSLSCGAETIFCSSTTKETVKTALEAIRVRMIKMSLKDREDTLKKLRQWAGVKEKNSQSLNIQELKALNAGGLVDVGAHTQWHLCLSSQSPEIQREEISKSKQTLENWLGRPVLGFAFPYGTRSSYNQKTLEILKEEGFLYSCSNFPGLVKKRTDLYQLPRFGVHNWSSDLFYQHLNSWWNA